MSLSKAITLTQSKLELLAKQTQSVRQVLERSKEKFFYEQRKLHSLQEIQIKKRKRRHLLKTINATHGHKAAKAIYEAWKKGELAL